MKIKDIISQNKLSLSFEVFPPKTETSFESVKNATQEIAKLKPSFVSVTYGAGGDGASHYTLDIAKNIEDLYGVPTLAHLTCVSSTKQTVREKIAQIKDYGISNVMALRGDIPEALENSDQSGWDYRHAIDLITELKESGGDFCIGAACYPEIHPESKNQKEDIKYLKEKVDAGVDFLTTQMFFDNNMLYSYLYQIQSKGIRVPVFAGIMPITNSNQVSKMVKLSSAYIPAKLLSICDRFSESPEAMRQAGIAYATDQIIDLISNGVRGIHIYTMNKPSVAQEIYRNVDKIISATNS